MTKSYTSNLNSLNHYEYNEIVAEMKLMGRAGLDETSIT